MAEKLVLSLIKRKCITIKEDSSISDLAELLTLNNIGAVVVVDINNKAIGIVSERDVIRNYNKDYHNIKNIMTNKLISCDLSISSTNLLEIMNKNKVRHIPIINKDKLLGIVSIGDVVKRLIETYENENINLKNFINS
ncbi:MAG: CBS domain-containing protein [Alphaproteobacteria bacterium]|mgnify:FL=1|jgi:CBS domain-containing protein|tara:strand:- start:176 stop:589 length:414 start_codon:yes stop_codon:yes gene_type:complete